jgi:hypothetical protein
LVAVVAIAAIGVANVQTTTAGQQVATPPVEVKPVPDEGPSTDPVTTEVPTAPIGSSVDAGSPGSVEPLPPTTIVPAEHAPATGPADFVLTVRCAPAGGSASCSLRGTVVHTEATDRLQIQFGTMPGYSAIGSEVPLGKPDVVGPREFSATVPAPLTGTVCAWTVAVNGESRQSPPSNALCVDITDGTAGEVYPAPGTR